MLTKQFSEQVQLVTASLVSHETLKRFVFRCAIQRHNERLNYELIEQQL